MLMRTRRFFVVLTLALSSLGALTITPVQAQTAPPAGFTDRHAPASAELQAWLKSYGNPTVQEAVVTASHEFGLDGRRLLRIANCESSFNPRNVTGSHLGVFQHARAYWAGRVRAFNDKYLRLGRGLQNADPFDAVTNSRVSAFMMSEAGGFGPWECK